jgi:hypothetical protein
MSDGHGQLDDQGVGGTIIACWRIR